MGKDSSEPEVPAYQGGITRIGGRDISKNYKEGNNIVTEYNPTAQETQVYDYLQNALPSLYQKATSPQDFSSYVNDYTNNQMDELDKSYGRQLNTAKGALVSSGRMGSSQGLDSLIPFNEAYQSQAATIKANAPTLAQQLQGNDLNIKGSALANAVNGVNNYYGNATNFANASNTLSNMGNSYEQWAYPQKLAAYQRQKAEDEANQNAMISTAAQLGGALLTGGASLAMPGGGLYGGNSIMSNSQKFL